MTNSSTGISNGDANHAESNGNSTEPVCTVWHGFDVVLTDNCHPSEKKHQHQSNQASLGRPEDQRRQTVRRSSTGTGTSDSYGWLRQLDLRSDVPSIDEIRDWTFDVLEFEDSALIEVFIKMLEYYNLLEKFGLDKQMLRRYCEKVRDLHHKDCYYQQIEIENEAKKVVAEENQPEILCEYHNFYHAVSCALSSFLFLTLGGADKCLYPLDIFCIIMGGLIHDLDHPGTNNDFEIKRSTSLAKLYDNDAVLERHAINMGLNLCDENPELDWLSSFEDKDREYVKQFIAESVLSTDPARHGAMLKEALAFVEKGPQSYQSSSSTSELAYFNREDPQHRQFIGGLLLHAGDIFNPLHCNFQVASDWAIRVTIEFTRQVNKEKELQLPVTTFMDGLDSQVKIAKMQIGFFSWMVKPLFNTIGKLFPDLKQLEEWGERNSNEYQLVIDKHEEEQKASVQSEDQKGGTKDSGEDVADIDTKEERSDS